jgi:hypothetical protein
VQVDKIRVVSIEFPQFVTFKACCVHLMLNMNVLMWNNVMRFTMLVAWSFNVMDCKISGLFSFVYLEEKVFSCYYFCVCLVTQSFLVKLIFEVLKHKLLLYNRINLFLDFLMGWNIMIRYR